MYRLKEVGVIAFNQLVREISPYIHQPMEYATGIWSHIKLNTTFGLCVDDFGINYY